MRIVSWNINGIRSVLKKGFAESVKKLKPDILCLQETKAPAQGFSLEIPGFVEYGNPAEKAGYAGTALLSRVEPRKIIFGMGIPKHDQEGRLITAEYKDFFLVNVYVPNSKRGLERLPYRCEEWDKDFLKYLKRLEKKKPVVFCGDMNVAHQEIDLANPKANVKNHGFTPEERAGFDRILKSGFVDTFRLFEKEGGHYTWWSQMNNCRKRNIGWRIDYFCVSKALVRHVKKSQIHPEIMGSDHCPVSLELEGLEL